MLKLFFSRRENEPTVASVQPLAESTKFNKPVSRESGRRLISSRIVSEEFVDSSMKKKDHVTYVEVPMTEEVVRYIPKQSIVKVKKTIPKYQVEYIDRIVEVPQIVYVDNPVEVVVMKDEIKQVHVKQVKEVPVEVIKEVPKIQYKEIEKIVHVPGERIEVPKYYPVEKQVPVKHYKDTKVPVVVAQTMQPLVSITKETIDIPAFQYEPQLIHVDIRVPKPVKTSLIQAGVSEHIPRESVKIPSAQYNSLLKLLNANLTVEEQELLPYIREKDQVLFLKDGDLPPAVILNPEQIAKTSPPQESCWAFEKPFFSSCRRTTTTPTSKTIKYYPNTQGHCFKMSKPSCSPFGSFEKFNLFNIVNANSQHKQRRFFGC